MIVRHFSVTFLLLAMTTMAQAGIVTPTNVTFTGTAVELASTPENIINGSGLSDTLAADGSNLRTVTHGDATAAARWVTDAPNGAGGDYFAPAGSGGTVIFGLDLGSTFNLSTFASWGYAFGGNPNGNAISSVQFDFSTNGGSTTSSTQTVAVPLIFGEPAVIPLTPVNANFVTMTVLDNHFEGAVGGDRVGLAELRFFEGEVPGVVILEVNRDTGAITLRNNSSEALSFGDLGITSAAGALKPANWLSIANNYDEGGTVSADQWTQFSATKSDLTEGTLGTGTLGVGQSVALGVGVWLQSPTEDVVLEYVDLSTGELIFPTIEYVGSTVTEQFEIGDLNSDGDINTLDWPLYRDNYRADLSALTAVEAYRKGDLNGDGENNGLDFRVFKAAFEANNPGTSFAEMVSGSAVPEPATWTLFAVSFLFLAGRRSQQRQRLPSMAKLSLLLATTISFVAFSPSTHAVIVKPLTVTSTVDGNAGSSVDYLLNDNAGQALFSLQNPVETEAFVNDGDTLLDALATFAQHGGVGHQESWTRQTGQGNPVFAFDLGSEKSIGSVVLWNYGNNGGGEDRNGNATREFELIFHSTAEGATFDFASDGGAEAVEFDGTMFRPDAGDGLAAGTVDNPAQFFGFGGLETARYVGLRIASNYLGEEGVVAGGDRYGLGEVRFATDLSPPALTLEVNTVTGNIKILGDPTVPFDINQYEILSNTSEDTLNPAGWSSLADQDFEGSGPVNNSGDGWEELGTPTTSVLAEAFLRGSSVIEAGTSINLGPAYDPSVLGSGQEGNLDFTFQTPGGAIQTGLISYVTDVDPGDFDGDGNVDGNDFLSWQRGAHSASDLSDWKANFGGGGGSLSATTAVPEPSSLGLLMLAVGFFTFSVRRRQQQGGSFMARRSLFRSLSCSLIRRLSCSAIRSGFLQGGLVRVTVGCLVFVCLASQSLVGYAAVTNDREYSFGEDSDETASQGAIVGSSSIVPQSTLDSKGPTGAFLDLAQSGGATYQDVDATGGLSRPGASNGDFGVRFDGVDDRLVGTRLNRPDELNSLTSNEYPIDYSGVTTRGLQSWVYPDQAALSAGNFQSVVYDSILSGGPAINELGQWTQINANHGDGANGIDQVPATVAVPAGNTWYHVMHNNFVSADASSAQVVPGTGAVGAFNSILYVNGVAVSANNDNIPLSATFDADFIGDLVVGAAELDTDNANTIEGYGNFFKGVVDDLDMFVHGGTFGDFDLFADNEWIQQEIAKLPGGVLKPGDVNRNGTVSGDGTGSVATDDVAAFIAGWKNENILRGSRNSIRVGDWNSWDMGDFNQDGITNLLDWHLLRINHSGGASLNLGTLLNSAAVPEPTSAALLLLGVASSGLLKRGRRRPRS